MPSLVNRQVESIGEYLLLIVLYGGKLWFVYILFVMITVWTFLFIYKGQGRMDNPWLICSRCVC